MTQLGSHAQARRTLREQVQVNHAAGYCPLRARLAVLDVLAVRAASELEYIWRKYQGRLRVRKQDECAVYWRAFWATLRHHLDTGLRDDATVLIDAAIDRVEPQA